VLCVAEGSCKVALLHSISCARLYDPTEECSLRTVGCPRAWINSRWGVECFAWSFNHGAHCFYFSTGLPQHITSIQLKLEGCFCLLLLNVRFSDASGLRTCQIKIHLARRLHRKSHKFKEQLCSLPQTLYWTDPKIIKASGLLLIVSMRDLPIEVNYIFTPL
jgi:hypothetical protein